MLELSPGWIGSICLAICGVPALIQALRVGNVQGMNFYFIFLWWLGEVLMVYHALQFNDGALNFNYLSNTIITSLLLYYKVFPRNGSKV